MAKDDTSRDEAATKASIRPPALRVLCPSSSQAGSRFSAACRDPAFLMLIAGLLATAGSCGGTVEESPGTVNTGGTGGSADASADSAKGGTGGSVSKGGAGGSSLGGAGLGGQGGTTIDAEPPKDAEPDASCPPYSTIGIFEVPSPEPGVAPDPATLCAVNEPGVTSNQAAQVTLAITPPNVGIAKGHIKIVPAVLAAMTGPPIVEVVDAITPALKEMVVSDLQPVADGYTFVATWSNPQGIPGPVGWEGTSYLSLRVTLTITCNAAGTETQQVRSLTHLDLCGGSTADMQWKSSGETCVYCQYMAETAAAPLPAQEKTDDLPLPYKSPVRLVPTASYGNVLILVAEGNPTPAEYRYDWTVSGGDILWNTGDLVVWRMPEAAGPHLAQVAVEDATSLSVAALRWRNGG